VWWGRELCRPQEAPGFHSKCDRSQWQIWPGEQRRCILKALYSSVKNRRADGRVQGRLLQVQVRWLSQARRAEGVDGADVGYSQRQASQLKMGCLVRKRTKSRMICIFFP
jgi:hypothetical protein